MLRHVPRELSESLPLLTRSVPSCTLRTFAPSVRSLTLATLVSFVAGAQPLLAFEGRVVDARSGTPLPDAEVVIVGLTGSARTDADGRFTWRPDPTPPFEILVILSGGQVTRPVLVETVDWAVTLTVRVSSVVDEQVTVVAGVAPSIDATPVAGTTLITGRELLQRSPANLMQSLENVAGVNQVSEGHVAVPAVRGLSSSRTLVLLDGARVTTERRVGPSATFVDPSSIDGVEVARGPGSVAYGSDAFGGIISITTRRPEPGSPLRFRFSGTLATGTPEQRGAVEVSKGFPTGGIILQGHWRNAEDYRGSDGKKAFNSGWEDRGFLVRIRTRLGAGIATIAWQSDFGRNIERLRDNSRAVRISHPHEDSHRLTASYELTPRAGMSRVLLNGFLGRYRLRTDQDRFATASIGRSVSRADVSANDFGVRMTAEGFAGPAKLEFGVDSHGRFGLQVHDTRVTYALHGFETSRFRSTPIADARRIDIAAFLQSEVTPAPRVVFGGGVRLDRVTITTTEGFFGNRSTSNGAGSGFGSLTLEPFRRVSVTGQVSRGFRDPLLSDRYYRGPTGRGFVTGSPNLSPETSLQFDLAVRLTTPRARAAVYVYQYRLNSLIERYEADTDLFFFRNRGRARVRGVEIELQGNLGLGLATEISGQIARGVTLGDDTALDGIGGNTLRIVLRKELARRGYAHVRAAFFTDDDRPGPTEQRTNGYTLVEVGAGWRLLPSLELRGLVRNVLDTAYLATPDLRAVQGPGVAASITAVVQLARSAP